MKRTGPTNEHVKELINELKKESSTHKNKIWKRIAQELEKPTRKRRVINIARINRTTKENETILVPGKVLGSGILNHSLTIAAYAFSQSAKKQIQQAKGKTVTIQELLKNNPKGKDIRIIG